eukprot:CAMPEP_0178872720 /NCGR_PEP_ID=MMETSP0747-20121128/8277_1 /TAXON_ID=913974 /ORGANISM="Nitzschia punctata, Strain CCMP561" /LENGTH=743 /DNA_ID=CAMNT_0020539959 /DNA_START=291 /DNA_END=2522 /DNA_ORIENTATION=+
MPAKATKGKKKKKSSYEDSYGESSGEGNRIERDEGYDGHHHKKKKAKERKRELESMYGSQPLPPRPHTTGNARLSKSLPSDFDDESPASRDKKKKAKHGKKKNASKLEGSDESFGFDDLVQQPGRTKMPRGSNNMSFEESFAVDDLVVQSRTSRPERSNSSRPTLTRGRSAERNPQIMHRQNSSRPGMQRSNSQAPPSRSLSRGASSRRGVSVDRGAFESSYGELDVRRGTRPGMEKQLSRPGLARQQSKAGFPRQDSRVGLARQASRPGLARQESRAGLARQASRPGLATQGSRPALTSQLSRSQSIARVGNASFVGSQPVRGRKNMRRFLPGKEIEETPPRSIVLIWVIVAAELGFDLATTIIAFQSFLGEDTCCGNPITLGSIPISSTIPFFLLVVAELAFLIRAIVLTLWPSILVNDDDTETDDLEDPSKRKPKRGCFARYCCCVLRWKARFVLQILNFLVLLNPFFGCIIAWILMYQSDKTEAFVVLGLEGASLVLHFISVYLEGSYKTCREILFHSIPVLPFFVSIGLVLYYLKQGGVCYLVNERVFKFTGCEICNFTGIPEPCPNATNLFNGLDSLETFDDVKNKLTERTSQATYCTEEEISFCFYDYDDGQVDPVNVVPTSMPSELLFEQDVTSAPVASPSEIGEPTSPPVMPNELPNDPPLTSAPSNIPMSDLDPPTEVPTPEPSTNVPTQNPTESPIASVPTEEPPDDTSGSDGFNMDEAPGQDAFDPSDFFN